MTFLLHHLNLVVVVMLQFSVGLLLHTYYIYKLLLIPYKVMKVVVALVRNIVKERRGKWIVSLQRSRILSHCLLWRLVYGTP